MTTPLDVSIPDRLAEEYWKLTKEGLIALELNNFSQAVAHFTTLYQLLDEPQKHEKRPIHKGSVLHHRGIALYGEGQYDEAVLWILMAYIEDALNTDFDREDDSDRAPAAAMLRDVLQFDLRVLREIKAACRHIKEKGKRKEITNPRDVLDMVASPLKLNQGNLSALCQQKPPLVGKNLLGFPQPPDRRVFIGSSYDVGALMTGIVKEAVVRRGYTPVVVFDYAIKRENIHDASLQILHTCSYAIIDISKPGGQYIEIERARDYGTKVLLIKSAMDASSAIPASAMVETLVYPIKIYSNKDDLGKIVSDFLPP